MQEWLFKTGLPPVLGLYRAFVYPGCQLVVLKLCMCNHMMHVSDSGISASNLLELWYRIVIQGTYQGLLSTIVGHHALRRWSANVFTSHAPLRLIMGSCVCITTGSNKQSLAWEVTQTQPDLLGAKLPS